MAKKYFESQFLDKTVLITDVPQLSNEELSDLEEELRIAIENMNQKMYSSRDTGDPEWLTRLAWKIKLCERFLIKVLTARTPAHVQYFYNLVADEIGEQKTAELYSKAQQTNPSELIAKPVCSVAGSWDWSSKSFK
tara:strand:- start:1098 stop:1505 length:408 start_codon:yes stop_codon:yes gene_type:complete